MYKDNEAALINFLFSQSFYILYFISEGGNGVGDRISVIIPVYNVEGYLERCLMSVIGQTYENLEIILVNDGSTDGSGELCDEFAAADSRIQVIHKENGGLSDARNVGMDMATGEYIGFIDSDDWVDRDMYEVLYGLLIEHDAEVSICRYRNIYNDWTEDESTDQIEVYDNLSALRAIIVNENNLFPTHNVWNKLYKRELVDKFRFIKGKLVEDLYFTPYVVFASRRSVYTNSAKYNYLRERPDSIMNTPVNIRRMNDELDGYVEIAKFLDGLNLEDAALVMKQEFLKKLMEFQVEIKNSKVQNKAETLKSFQLKFSESPYRKLKNRMDPKIRMQINVFEISPFLFKHGRNLRQNLRMLRKKLA